MFVYVLDSLFLHAELFRRLEGRSNAEEAYFNQVKRYDIALWDLIYCLNFILCFLERLLEVLEIPPSVIQSFLALYWWLSHHASPWWSAGRRTIGRRAGYAVPPGDGKEENVVMRGRFLDEHAAMEEESHINEDGGIDDDFLVHVLFEILLLLLLLLLLLILVHPLLLFLLPLLLLFFFFLPRLLVFFFFFLPHLLLLHLILLLLLFLFFFLLLLVLIEHLLFILHPPRLVLQQAGLVVSCVEDLSLCVLLGVACTSSSSSSGS